MEVDDLGWNDEDLEGSQLPLPNDPQTVPGSNSSIIRDSPPNSVDTGFTPKGDQNGNIKDHSPPRRFDILSSAPRDHAFYETSPGQHSKAFLGRLAREYRVLESSLPESIIVRAYEDRTDLLRSLIIGPENTPYENAPFVIDWMLDSNFPNTPPIAHFWSWTAGNGRGEYSWLIFFRLRTENEGPSSQSVSVYCCQRQKRLVSQ